MTDREKFEAYFNPVAESMKVHGVHIFEIMQRKDQQWQGWQAALASQQPDKSELVDHLAKASAIVATWPKWKREGSDATKFTSRVTGIDPAHVNENLQPGEYIVEIKTLGGAAILNGVPEKHRASGENLKHVGYLFVNPEGAVVYSPSGYGMKGFTCAGKIYGDVNLQQEQSESAWIQWEGGECPVGRDAQVDVKFSGAWGGIGRAGSMFWSHDGGDSDIIAYRVVNP